MKCETKFYICFHKKRKLPGWIFLSRREKFGVCFLSAWKIFVTGPESNSYWISDRSRKYVHSINLGALLWIRADPLAEDLNPIFGNELRQKKRKIKALWSSFKSDFFSKKCSLQLRCCLSHNSGYGTARSDPYKSWVLDLIVFNTKEIPLRQYIILYNT